LSAKNELSPLFTGFVVFSITSLTICDAGFFVPSGLSINIIYETHAPNATKVLTKIIVHFFSII
jgi:hypothetical protein